MRCLSFKDSLNESIQPNYSQIVVILISWLSPVCWRKHWFHNIVFIDLNTSCFCQINIGLLCHSEAPGNPDKKGYISNTCKMMKPSFPLGVSPSALMVIAGVTMEIPFSRVTIQIFSHIARKVNLHQVLLLEAFHTKGIMLKAVMTVSYFWELHHHSWFVY